MATKKQKEQANALIKSGAKKLVAEGINPKLSTVQRTKTAPKIEIKKEKIFTKTK
ncbi:MULTISPECIES: hypothetical protein [Snodgrassella]|uniref:hypothetical protein n=1 Tax=Snodgrassella TaxID=1193515 RepID=UPI000815C43E|nr:MULTISPECIES: hypothetical protein [Snodgrassella]MCO6521236.1 hypothetical protein [Snodgrassella sp.]SCC04531.1 hypothetical protein GA0061082_10728 [Snodgrassella sp. R-53583]